MLGLDWIISLLLLQLGLRVHRSFWVIKARAWCLATVGDCAATLYICDFAPNLDMMREALF